MKSVIVITMLAVALATAPAAGQAGKVVKLGDAKDMLILPIGDGGIPLVVVPFDKAAVRFSPSFDGCIYMAGSGGPGYGQFYLRSLSPAAEANSTLETKPITAPMSEPQPAGTARESLTGINWRADGKAVAYIRLCREKNDGTVAPAAAVYHMDTPVRQWEELGRQHAPNATVPTSISYSPDGKTIWMAYGEPTTSAACSVAGESGIVYQRDGRTIYHLSPSLDGKRLAWLEIPERKADGEEPELVVFDVAERKTVHRIALDRDARGPDAQSPVWADSGKTLIYGNLGHGPKRGAWWREVFALDTATGRSRMIATDAVAIGALGELVVLNVGPGSGTVRALLSSLHEPGAHTAPTRQTISVAKLSTGEVVELMEDAQARQVVGDWLVYRRPEPSGRGQVPTRMTFTRVQLYPVAGKP